MSYRAPIDCYEYCLAETSYACSRDTFYRLSIMIPTFNRCNQLSKLLHLLENEIEGVCDSVELLISDNCSHDDTEIFVKQFIARNDKRYAVRYFRQRENIGPAKNIHFLVVNSRSEYSWAIGDDDELKTLTVINLLKVLGSLSPLLLLIRAEGIYEWDKIKGSKTPNVLSIGIDDINVQNYLFAATFLASVVIKTNVWVELMPRLKKLESTCYANWAAPLMAFNLQKSVSIIDAPCILGNHNMVGPSLIPSFNILILGRLRVWSELRDSPSGQILASAICKLAKAGWLNIAMNQCNDVKNSRDKINALLSMYKNARGLNFSVYFIAILVIVIPIKPLWVVARLLALKFKKIII